jgi:glycosyltransferase involved in cell wall biosynthesis
MNNTAALVSIIVATYKTQHAHLHAALHSALSQSHPHLEILVVDDSPTNSLRSLVQGLGDGRVRYQHNQPALGVAHNHWQALAQARGEFVVVLNHDDWLAPEFVQVMLAALQAQPQVVLAFCDHWVINSQGQRLLRQSDEVSAAWGRSNLAPGLHPTFAGLVVSQSIPMVMGTLFRRSALPAHWPEHAGPAYDLWLAFLLCRTGGAAWYVPQRLSAWRTHTGNLTSIAGMDWRLGAASCWQAMLQEPLFARHQAQVRARAAGAWRACATGAWRQGRLWQAAHFAWRAIQSMHSTGPQAHAAFKAPVP